MSLIPYILDNFLRDSLFGSELNPRDFWTMPLERRLFRSISSPLGYLRSQLAEMDDLVQKMHITEDGFDIKLDVEDFKPEEVTVKTVGNSIVIEAKHEERKDSELGYVSRQIVRKYELPTGFKPDKVISNLSSDGVLEVKCPKYETLEGVLVRNVPIQQTGPIRVPIKKVDEKAEKVSKERPEESSELKIEEAE